MPQPIDPQTELGRATAAERIQQIADRASLAAQARASAELANARASAETQVHRTAKKNDEVDRELRRRTPFVGRRRNPKGKNGEPEDSRTRHFYNAAEKEVVADDLDAHRLDIEI
jgi:hypothetical protein